MSVSISCDSRLNSSSKLENCQLFYSGRYEVDLVKSEVKHFVDIALSMERVGKLELRNYKIEGKTLTLQANGDFGKALLVWEKV